MKCPVCGSDYAKIEYKRGKGKFNAKHAVVGAILTGGIGAVAGFSGKIAEKGYLTCPHCRYDQYSKVNPQYVLSRKIMEQIGGETISPRFISLGELRGIFGKAASARRLPSRFRLDEIEGGRGGKTTSFPCLIIEHPGHPTDYFKFCITMDTEGDRCVFTPFVFGNSPQLSMISYNENAGSQYGIGLATAAAGVLTKNSRLTGAGLGYELSNRAVTNFIKNRNDKRIDCGAAAFEKDWYAQVMSLIQTAL